MLTRRAVTTTGGFATGCASGGRGDAAGAVMLGAGWDGTMATGVAVETVTLGGSVTAGVGGSAVITGGGDAGGSTAASGIAVAAAAGGGAAFGSLRRKRKTKPPTNMTAARNAIDAVAMAEGVSRGGVRSGEPKPELGSPPMIQGRTEDSGGGIVLGAVLIAGIGWKPGCAACIGGWKLGVGTSNRRIGCADWLGATTWETCINAGGIGWKSEKS